MSPVVIAFSPTAAAMSPARTSLSSSRVISMHLENAPDTLFLALDGVIDAVAGFHDP